MGTCRYIVREIIAPISNDLEFSTPKSQSSIAQFNKSGIRSVASHTESKQSLINMLFQSSHEGCPSAERLVHSRSLTLSDWTGSFAECTLAPSVPKRPGPASILKACAKGGPARPARDLKSLHGPA